jgi:hypothetical protein
MQRDLAELRAIRGRIDTAIVGLQGVTFDARAAEVQEAVRVAVSHVRFFGPGHGQKGEVALRKIISLLAPEVSEVLEDEGPVEAHKIVDPAMRGDGRSVSTTLPVPYIGVEVG